MFEFLKKKKSKNKKALALERIKLSEYQNHLSYPSNNLTPEKLAKIFRLADTGEISLQSELYEEMEEKDPHLFSLMQTRKNSICGLEFEIIGGSEEEEDKKIAKFIDESIKGIKNFDDGLLDLLDAIGKGISFLEIIWKYEKEKFIVDELKYINAKNFFWDEKDKLKIRTKEDINGIELAKNKFIIHKYKARSGHSTRGGILRVIAWVYLFKNYAFKDWVIFTEKYGMPLMIGKYDEGSSEDEKNELMEALFNLGSDSAGAIPKNTDIDITESNKNTSAEIYEKLARFCDEQMSKAILGQTLTSDSGGSYAQSKTHNEVRHDLTSADCKSLASTLKEYLIKPLVKFNFGEDAHVPEIAFNFEETEDLLQTAEIYSKLINEIGLVISKEHIYKKFKVPKPEYSEKLKETKKETKEETKEETKKELKREIKKTKEETQIFKLTDNNYNGSQKEVDILADKIIKKSVSSFKNIFEIAIKDIGQVNDLEEIKRRLEDEKYIETLFEKMEDKSKRVKTSLKNGMLLSNIIGRSIEENER